MLVLCLVSALGNAALGILVSGIFGAPLYLDTVFTVAIIFSFGLLPGMLTGVLLYPLCEILRNLLFHSGESIFWAGNAFVLCTVTEMLLVCFFRTKLKMRQRLFAKEAPLSSFISTAARLMVLVALDCILISIMGGIIDFALFKLVSAPRGLYPEDIFKLGLIRNNVPVPAAAILSRIPINIVDRFIAVFGGYGISLLYRRIGEDSDGGRGL
ncbi:hypothetical protein [Leadbettera azotonutricia]|uniref:ECF transporter S component n=1 Tax=Leadbettera azotonutricia (strain ATCC BAA-888 / DSM 13862 / ZAS-9) TaxID=545695 RepID=F5YB83_LEAAZ|nr:hypothetical protein [Leadbettera azotonutricia]AEF82653.1 hypothetical protein TREAZ_2986 [Leadbettera azotonutricia ZAS-9]